MRKRLIFMGSPAFAVPSLRALQAAGHEIVAVYSQPPRPAGRGEKLQKTAIHEEAERLGLGPVRTPERLKGADLEELLALECDVICVVAYGLLLPKALVDNRICLNVHPSALPLLRGAAPLQWTLIEGHSQTQVCVMQLDVGMDTGPVRDRTDVTVEKDWDYGRLQDVCAAVGAERLAAVVADLQDFPPVAQVGAATHAPKITKEMRRIDWTKDSATVANLVRGLAPVPGATALLGDEIVKVGKAYDLGSVSGQKGVGEWSVSAGGASVWVGCGTGMVEVELLQRPGGKMLPAGEVMRGLRDTVEVIFS